MNDPFERWFLWELRYGDRVIACELQAHDQPVAEAVRLLLDGEVLVSQVCVTADAVRYVGASFRKGHLRTGWSE